jgi:hypothetical protein
MDWLWSMVKFVAFCLAISWVWDSFLKDIVEGILGSMAWYKRRRERIALDKKKHRIFELEGKRFLVSIKGVGSDAIRLGIIGRMTHLGLTVVYDEGTEDDLLPEDTTEIEFIFGTEDEDGKIGKTYSLQLQVVVDDMYKVAGTLYSDDKDELVSKAVDYLIDELHDKDI